MKLQFKKMTSHCLIACVVAMSLPIQAAHAGIVGTETIISAQDAKLQRANVQQFLSRSDVAAEMKRQGVELATAQARVDAMTDHEVAKIAGQIDKAPAGGDSILGIIFTVFIILLITDILGLTKVFPFTRPVR